MYHFEFEMSGQSQNMHTRGGLTKGERLFYNSCQGIRLRNPIKSASAAYRGVMPISPEVLTKYDRLRSEPNSLFGNSLSFLNSFLRDALHRVVPGVDESALARVATNCKPTSSVIEKIDRPTRKVYETPPNGQITTLEQLETEIRDLVRGRVVVDYLSEANILSKEILGTADREKWLTSDPDLKENLNSPDDNGYRAFHVTLYVTTPYGQCYCEIQLFTVNQYSWASKTHPLMWKPEVEPPFHLKEIMKHLSECLHTSDRLFEVVRDYLNSPASRGR